MKKAFLIMVAITVSLSAKFTTINIKTFEEMRKKGVVVVDIRRKEEWQKTGIIKGAKTITFFDKDGDYDFIKFMAKFTKYVKNKHQPFIIYCAHANRTKVLGKALSQMFYLENVYDLEDGIENGWLKAGKKTVKYKGN